MKSCYQLRLLGDTSCEACQKTKSRFFELLKERGLDEEMIVVLDGVLTLTTKDAGGYDSAKPSFAFYFGKQGHGDKDVDAVKKLMGNADAVYPVFFSNFKQEVPDVLWLINGVKFIDDKIDSMVNVAFEELRLLRKKRRVFISYKRSDSAAVANQLYDVLSRCQFDVFLDTYSIRGAADFQAELRHRITDCDVLVQLNSQGFKDSNWCKDEISEANARRVGVLQVNWPGVSPDAADQLSVTKRLHDIDFKRKRYKRNTSVLKSKVLNEIALTVEAIRARNIAARQDNLTGEFVKEANRQGRTIIKDPIFLVEQKSNGKFWYYIPEIGVPQSVDCHESIKMLESWNGMMADKVFLIYDDLSILPNWIAHLDWMNKYLEVKTIKMQEFESWLKTMK
jgi:hypothetical protein